MLLLSREKPYLQVHFFSLARKICKCQHAASTPTRSPTHVDLALGRWRLIVRQTMPFFFTSSIGLSGQLNINDPTNDDYCVAYTLPGNRLSSGEYVFRLVSPNAPNLTWAQTSNPWNDRNRVITGFTKISPAPATFTGLGWRNDNGMFYSNFGWWYIVVVISGGAECRR